MPDPITHLPTQGHILTALDYHVHQDRIARNTVPCGVMVKYPAALPPPAGWVRCTGGPIDAQVHPRLSTAYQGQLPNDPEYIVKL